MDFKPQNSPISMLAVEFREFGKSMHLKVAKIQKYCISLVPMLSILDKKAVGLFFLTKTDFKNENIVAATV